MDLNTIKCSKAEDYLVTLPTGSIDMIITSPPYGDLRKYHGNTWDFETIAHESYRVLKDNGVMVWVEGDRVVKYSETLTPMRHAIYFKDIVGFLIHDTMIYSKKGVVFPIKSRYHDSWEYMFVLSKGQPKTYNLLKEVPNKYVGDKLTSTQRENKNNKIVPTHGLVNGKKVSEYSAYQNVWVIDSGYMKTTKDKEAYKHPAMFPEELVRRHILTWSDEGGIVLDYFMGSGTTAKIAKLYNRNYLGCDVSQEYVDLANSRLKD